MPVPQFVVIFARFFGGDAKVRRGFVYTGRAGRVRQVVVDKMANLPEEGIVHGFS